VIFDCDGLLVDTETAWTRAERELYARRGVEFTMDHKRELLGSSAEVAGTIVERHLGLPPGGSRALVDELYALVTREIARSAPPMPGAPELVAALRDAGTAIGLASNSPPDLVALSLRVSGLAGAFDVVVSAHEVGAGKPAPDVYLAACERLGAEPAGAVALEDSHTGTLAARAAGLYVIGVPSIEGVELPAAHLVAPALHHRAVHAAVGLRLAA